MVEVKWTLQSLEDMENIADYIAKSRRIIPETNNNDIREFIDGIYHDTLSLQE